MHTNSINVKILTTNLSIRIEYIPLIKRSWLTKSTNKNMTHHNGELHKEFNNEFALIVASKHYDKSLNKNSRAQLWGNTLYKLKRL